jgi:hypothetical protein
MGHTPILWSEQKSPLKTKRRLAPSASLRISAAGSRCPYARKAPQLEWGTRSVEAVVGTESAQRRRVATALKNFRSAIQFRQRCLHEPVILFSDE